MYDKAKVKKLVILCSLSFLALTGIVGVIFVATQIGGNQIANDRSELEVFKNSDLDNIRERVRGYLGSYGLSAKEVNDAKIVIRKGSVKTRTESHDGAVYASFLVDIDNPKLTYEGSLLVGGDDDELFMTCPAISLMQDPNVFCVGNERESTIDVALGNYLPYDSQEAGDTPMEITMWPDYDEDGWPRLRANVGACENGADGEQARKFIKEWIRNKGGINPDIIPLKIEYVDCSSTYINDQDTSDDPNFSWR